MIKVALTRNTAMPRRPGINPGMGGGPRRYQSKKAAMAAPSPQSEPKCTNTTGATNRHTVKSSPNAIITIRYGSDFLFSMRYATQKHLAERPNAIDHLRRPLSKHTIYAHYKAVGGVGCSALLACCCCVLILLTFTADTNQSILLCILSSATPLL